MIEDRRARAMSSTSVGSNRMPPAPSSSACAPVSDATTTAELHIASSAGIPNPS